MIGVRGRAGLGFAAWLALLAWLRPWPLFLDGAAALLLLAPLVLAPLLFDLAGSKSALDAALLTLAQQLALPAALLLAAAFTRPIGSFAAALTFPWLGVTVLAAFAGLARLAASWTRRELDAVGFGLAAGLAYPAIGAGWALLSRAGLQPMGFSDAVVLLTAVHFHHAGFALPILAALAARAHPGRAGRVPRLGVAAVVGGVPLVAAGITATQLGQGPALEALAALVTAIGGAIVAGSHLALARDPAWPRSARLGLALAGASLLAGMVLAALYGLRAWLPIPRLDLLAMIALHGSVNALGFGLCGSLAWRRAGAAGDRPITDRGDHGRVR